MNNRRPAKNPHAEAEQFRRRAVLGFLAVALALVGLGAWYFRLQVLQHADYATRSEANRIRPRPVVPARGMIYDRQGRLLAENVPAFRLDVTPDKARRHRRTAGRPGPGDRAGRRRDRALPPGAQGRPRFHADRAEAAP